MIIEIAQNRFFSIQISHQLVNEVPAIKIIIALNSHNIYLFYFYQMQYTTLNKKYNNIINISCMAYVCSAGISTYRIPRAAIEKIGPSFAFHSSIQPSRCTLLYHTMIEYHKYSYNHNYVYVFAGELRMYVCAKCDIPYLFPIS